MSTRNNPASNNTLIMVGLAAVAFYGYTKGWFSSLLGSSPAAAAPAAPITYNMGSGNDTATYNGVQVTFDKANSDLTYKSKVLTLLANAAQNTVGVWDSIYYIAYGGSPLKITLPASAQASATMDAPTYINSRFAAGLSGYGGMGDFQNYMHRVTGRRLPVRVA